ncbi:tubulin alpha-8 chain-like [Cimex lectularius]|uniref:Tubulin alpha chain n=1 Tax=Cimex lectularius TaxID=79782 RepID=A0A8I6THU1_CIMLE|nr:tubulin alpha-8 chain-like [Cimex lectularius]
MREVISIHLGQAGVQLGNIGWELYCLEHNLLENGYLSQAQAPMDQQLRCSGEGKNCIVEGFRSFFYENTSGSYSPRAIFVDLDPTVIDDIRSGRFKNLYSPNNLISGKEDAANNFARGYLTSGRAILESVMSPIYKLAESCDRLQGFMLYHSFGGGTGSGLHALVTKALTKEFQKLTKLEIAVFPSPKMSTAVVEPYNAVLATDATLEEAECVFLADNEAMYSICQKKMDIDSPSYTNLNRILAQAVSSITSSVRFKGSLNADFMDFQTNLVPYPRIHFPVMSYAPINSVQTHGHESLSVADITNKCFDTSSRMLQCENEAGRYMSCCLLYRGDVAPKDVNAAVSAIKEKKSIKFVQWSPTGFKIGINDSPPAVVPDGDLARSTRAVCMLCNTTAVKEAWTNLNIKYHLMLDKKAFFHWYLGEGLEANHFYDAQENLLTLEEEYELMNKVN